MSDHNLYPAVDPVKSGLTGHCPRCGEGKLFDGFLTVAPRCRVCGLDYSFADSGDGPAAFVILIIGFIVVGLALWMEVNYSPSLWVHFILWVPLAIILSLLAMRSIKGILINLQFRNKASQGRLDDDNE
ncbi:MULTISPECIES: DUF983 domain-containing protein [Brucella]|uniref:DUF983 domain-containing protein n=1 Tax=Brucella TaxID=234 RepID=UPI0009A15277|nr:MULTISPECIES: DUF983 domain-containing protein [Brucella]MQP41780.1 DUF983 domain-containing protein [Ochrobactrum sp. MYb237]PQZ42853.1 DUF983 domain-containing protein [Brucella pseudogrignonensis]PRA38005.1 DUF983 domain-containing protein [Brucella pseudogrignonensis]PRA63686.1 DUF983 domain-containing protein [Brucella pseudogrignonensis]